MSRKRMLFNTMASIVIVSVASLVGVFFVQAQRDNSAQVITEKPRDSIASAPRNDPPDPPMGMPRYSERVWTGDDFAGVIAEKSGDSEVVAIVEGTEVTRRDLRLLPDFLRKLDPGLSENAAIKESIVTLITGFAVQAEVTRRGLVPTIAEAQAYMQPSKDACYGPQGGPCRDHIASLGEDLDVYWSTILTEYRKGLGEIRLRTAFFERIREQDLGYENHIAAWRSFRDGLRSEANIVWQDERLQGLYEEALLEG